MFLFRVVYSVCNNSYSLISLIRVRSCRRCESLILLCLCVPHMLVAYLVRQHCTFIMLMHHQMLVLADNVFGSIVITRYLMSSWFAYDIIPQLLVLSMYLCERLSCTSTYCIATAHGSLWPDLFHAKVDCLVYLMKVRLLVLACFTYFV